ncbi:TfuA-like protein [Streptomyces sp. URMC 123]|uniref:TfuA-like protein n=1 Tax=Streptomyces sp. URMC 123 TaxID=3423403 RepID=UPI003F1CA40F
MTVHVFGGPTVGVDDVRAVLPDAVFHPPVAHGDLLRLAPGPASLFVIIDGFFHQRAPVRHKEILHALSHGAVVVGASSMGALRAAEMRTCGMVGVGRVFRDYVDGTIEADDEVAVAHADDGHYRPLSEPLVNIRHAVAAARRAGALAPEAADALIATAERLPYPERSWKMLERRLPGPGTGDGHPVRRVRAFLAEHPHHANLKRQDALEALNLVRAGELTTTKAPHPAAARTSYFLQWQAATVAHDATDGTGVPDLTVFHHAQLYAPDFPRRWRRHVLARITGGAGDGAAALAAAAERGITPEDLGEESLGHWLTEEDERVPPEERLLRVLTRSYREEPGSHPFYDITDELRALVPSWAESRRAARAALAAEAGALARNPARSARTLRGASVVEHLARTWHLEATNEPALTAAARDRGFLGLDQAVAAARVFLLERLRTGAAGRPAAQPTPAP